MTDNSLIPQNNQSPILHQLGKTLSLAEKLLSNQQALSQADWAWWDGLDDL